MSTRSPNPEQLLAIEHHGGVLLRAGAGSGKTFVLVEHIVYLTTKWIEEFKAKPNLNFEEFIRQKFSQVVMMTFTKKAAGEMSVRLNERFEILSCATHDDQKFWIWANEALPMLMVTTIDGFCRKLITSGYFPHLSTEAKIIFDTEREDQVSELLEEWFQARADKIDRDVLDIIIREKPALLTAYKDVFSDGELRLAWKKFSIDEIRPENLGQLLLKSFELNDLQDALGKILSLDLPEEKERSAFEKFVATAQSTGLPVVDSVDKLQIYKMLFDGKRLDGERSAKNKDNVTHKNALEGLRALREWQKDWVQPISDYSVHFETKVVPWMKLCLEIFTFIDERLDPNQGMTFGDIEFLVATSLENELDRDRINKVYQYFIVDEFQDTSALQFKIISRLINQDYSRLFCVGDAKQAIYGFRGGELSVFKDCSELVPTVRSLANNYRSLGEIINFNNSLFRTLLPLGQEFTGVDPFSVSPEDQSIPADGKKSEVKGEIEVHSAELQRDLETDGKFTNEDINRLEAHLMAQSIEQERKDHPQDVCTILYSKLKPSGELIRELMNRKIGFTAQFKSNLLDDPIVGIFLCLLKRQFDKNEQTLNRFPLFLIETYLKVLGIKKIVSVDDLDFFDHDVNYWGLLEAFRKFLHKLNITNENSDINLGVIEVISSIYHQDPESIMVQIKDGNNQRISLDLRSGENAHMVQIMTAHASKGLEFDTVYLGGIYTNGKEIYDSALFGDLPGSFQWYIDLSQRNKQKSPIYLFESELANYKNFSEAKRLFYVAATRAKKKLVWVNLDIPEKTFSVPKNSWIDGINIWLSKSSLESTQVHIINHEAFDSKALLDSQSLPELPLFFHDSVGVMPKIEESGDLGILAELSVTRLNSLIDCPRKFYFENILKITPSKETVFYYQTDEGESIEEEEEVAVVVNSSADRGTKIHAHIARGLERNFVVPREVYGTPMEKPVQWAIDSLKAYRSDYEFLAEKQIKFKLFNFMISGIPDLVLLPLKEENLAQVWDFKTGRSQKESLAHYWVQLKTYAYALYVLGIVDKKISIETKLCFVDEEKFFTLKVDWTSVQAELFTLWQSQNRPWEIKTDHCSQCSYGDICPR